MSYYHGRKGDFFGGVAGSGLQLGLAGVGAAIGGPIGGIVGGLAGTIGSAFGSAISELGSSEWGTGAFSRMADQLRENVLGGRFGSYVGGQSAFPPPALAQNLGSFLFGDTPLTRPGAPIDFDLENPSTDPPIYGSFTNMNPEPDEGMDWFDYSS